MERIVESAVAAATTTVVAAIVGTALAGLVGACDGELTVGQLLGGIGALLDVPVAELTSTLLPAVRDLVRDGVLEPPIHR